MVKLFKKLGKKALRLMKIAVPSGVRIRTDAEIFGIIRFIEFASKEVRPSDTVLDAGAGSCPYKRYFSHAHYESTDFDGILDKTGKSKHDFLCSLDDIPKPNNFYDVIVNTQVLEHVEYPQKVVNEFYRILKPGGKLFLTAPQGWGIHDEPYHFFNFTKYGLASLFKNAGFKVAFIRPRGGMFWYVGKRIKTLPQYIFSQYVGKKNDSSFKTTLMPLSYLLSISYPFRSVNS